MGFDFLNASALYRFNKAYKKDETTQKKALFMTNKKNLRTLKINSQKVKPQKKEKNQKNLSVNRSFVRSLSILFFDMFYSIIMWHNFSGSVVLITGKMALRMNNKSLSLSAIASMM